MTIAYQSFHLSILVNITTIYNTGMASSVLSINGYGIFTYLMLRNFIDLTWSFIRAINGLNITTRD